MNASQEVARYRVSIKRQLRKAGIVFKNEYATGILELALADLNRALTQQDAMAKSIVRGSEKIEIVKTESVVIKFHELTHVKDTDITEPHRVTKVTQKITTASVNRNKIGLYEESYFNISYLFNGISYGSECVA